MNYGPVLEKLAHWHPGTVATFLEDIAEPDNSLDTLLDRPREAFQEIFTSTIHRPAGSRLVILVRQEPGGHLP